MRLLVYFVYKYRSMVIGNTNICVKAVSCEYKAHSLLFVLELISMKGSFYYSWGGGGEGGGSFLYGLGVISLRRIMTRVIPVRSEMTHASFCRGGSFLCITPALNNYRAFSYHVILILPLTTMVLFFRKVSSKIILCGRPPILLLYPLRLNPNYFRASFFVYVIKTINHL